MASNEVGPAGAADGQPAPVHWHADGRRWMEGGGPYSWRRNIDLCYDGGIGASGHGKMATEFSVEIAACEAAGGTDCFTSVVRTACYDETDPGQKPGGGPEWRCNPRCVTQDDFVDELMLNSDMGLFWQFTVDPTTGRQSGCGGLGQAAGQVHTVNTQNERDGTDNIACIPYTDRCYCRACWTGGGWRAPSSAPALWSARRRPLPASSAPTRPTSRDGWRTSPRCSTS